MSKALEHVQAIRNLVNAWWSKRAHFARLSVWLLDHSPWRNSRKHVAVAQIALEVERAHYASGEKGKKP